MINVIPVFGWLLALAVSISMAVPFWIVWTFFEVGETYFYWLPPVYHRVGFWSCVGLFIVISILKVVFVPRGLIYVDVNNAKEKN